MVAELLFRQRIDYDDGAIVDMVIWRVPIPVHPTTHGLKYSLFYGRPGIREVGYDNERGRRPPPLPRRGNPLHIP
jgi:hypothetical protein